MRREKTGLNHTMAQNPVKSISQLSRAWQRLITAVALSEMLEHRVTDLRRHGDPELLLEAAEEWRVSLQSVDTQKLALGECLYTSVEWRCSQGATTAQALAAEVEAFNG